MNHLDTFIIDLALIMAAAGDTVTAMGRKDKLENYLMVLEMDEHIDTAAL